MKRTKLIASFAFIFLVLIMVMLNVASGSFFYRFDLTQDNRYSINEPTIELLEKLDQKIYIEVYLDGELPSGFKRLSKSIKETLENFRVYAGTNIQYRFVDPSQNEDQKKQNSFYKQLMDKGLQPTNLQVREKGQIIDKIIFPGALVKMGTKEVAVQFLKGNQGVSTQQRLNQSVEGIEYELAAAIQNITTHRKKRIAMIAGHGEKLGPEFNDIGISLNEKYDIEPVVLPNVVSIENFDAIMVVQPDSFFTEPDKYKMDQFIINGGKALFFVDKVMIDMDSISENGVLSFPKNLNLDDFFYNLGIRIENHLVLDRNCAYVPMFVGYVGNQPNTKLMPWFYFPLINRFNEKHVTVKNLDAIYTRFCNTINLVNDGEGHNWLEEEQRNKLNIKEKTKANIIKTPLAFTSPYYTLSQAPSRVYFNQIKKQAPSDEEKTPLPVAVLLSGKFRSLYEGRLAPHTEKQFEFKVKNKESEVLVFSDGDVVLGERNKKTKKVYPAGYDRFSRIQFGNRDFLHNILAYMLDDNNLILAKAKNILVRPLDSVKTENDRTFWQHFNTTLPLLILTFVGLLRYFWRNYQYKNKTTVN